jgi:hypothetical protein
MNSPNRLVLIVALITVMASFVATAEPIRTNIETYAVPDLTSTWLYYVMNSRNYPAGIRSSPQPAFRGYINCAETNSQSVTPGGISCVLLSQKDADIDKGVTLPARSANWIFNTMEQDGRFEDGRGGKETFLGYLNCFESMSTPGDAASASLSCDLSIHEITN